MSKYTIQEELDYLEFGARWGCRTTNFINAAEHSAKRKATERELDIIVGRAFRGGVVKMCNYKHHDYGIDNDLEPPKGWSPRANPEWHWWVKKQRALLHIVTTTMNTAVSVERYQTAIMTTPYGNHYCILAPGGELINPDPNLEGTISKTLPLVY